MRRPRRYLRPGASDAVAILLAWGAGGCSALLSQPPQVTPLRSASECNPSVGPPIGDVILAGIAGATAVVGLGGAAIEKSQAANETVPSWDPHTRSGTGAGALLTTGGVAAIAAAGLILSARHGFGSASACKAATRKLMGSQPPTAPPGYPPDWGRRGGAYLLYPPR